MFKNCPSTFEKVTEENTLVLYSIVRKSLGMSAGKIAGQCQHAMQYLMEEYNKNNDDGLATHLFSRVNAWINTKTHTKVILEASDNEWAKLKEEYDPIVVIDAGKTEIAAGSETVICLYPMFRSERNGLLKRLQLLK